MKIDFKGRAPITDEQAEENIAYSRSLGLPELRQVRGPLAIVGGGPSIHVFEQVLAKWPGDIWAINGAWRWCRDSGIDAVFYTVDPEACAVPLAQGAKRAVLAYSCAPELFDSLKGANIQLIDTHAFITGPSSATTAIIPAIHCGALPITFYGCESSYSNTTRTHAYQNNPSRFWLKVRVGDEVFLTEPALVVQAVELAACIRKWPTLFREQSGGLLRALVNNPEWDAVEVSNDLNAILEIPQEAVLA